MRKLGLILIVISLLIPAAAMAELFKTYPARALVSQYFGIAALIVMSFAQILATRLPGIERVFGGLDRIYVLHKWLAVFAIICLWLHDTLDAEIKGLGPETNLMGIAEDVGEIAFDGLIVLVLVTLVTLIPYRLWRWSHKLIGLFFGLGVFHYIFIQKPYDVTDPLSLYVLTFCGAGVMSYLYLVFLYVRLPGPFRYQVRECRSFRDATEIIMAPEQKPLPYRPGQFAFFSFELDGLTETHPFTLSSAPDDSRDIRICVKGLGGYTDDLRRSIKPDTVVNVFGAFGHFRMPQNHDQQIWIAAGIGVTPFMSWARNLRHSGHGEKREGNVTLYYSVSSEVDAPFIDELEAIASEVPGFEVKLYVSSRDGRLTAAQIAANHEPLSAASAAFCGPKPMRDELRSGLVAAGLKKSRFQFEEFEIRSGLGFLQLARWLHKHFSVLNDLRRKPKPTP